MTLVAACERDACPQPRPAVIMQAALGEPCGTEGSCGPGLSCRPVYVVPGYDAVTALCKVLELLAPEQEALSSLVAALPRPTLVHRAVPCPWGRKGLVMRLLNEQLASRRLDLMDGVKAYDDRGWVQVLPDPDEPVVHLYAEGTTPELSEELASETSAAVEAIVQGDEAERRTLEQASS